METIHHIPGIGPVGPDSGLIRLDASSDGLFHAGEGGVVSVTATGDGKVAFIAFADRTLAYVGSSMGYPAYYPLHPVEIRKPVKAVLMDLDGTSVHSEAFWIWMIQQTVGSLLGDSGFTLKPEDMPYVSGHSVSEHLRYCIGKYVPGATVEEGRRLYFAHTHREMRAISEGGGQQDAFTPAPGLKEFLLTLKGKGVKIALVTSGLYEKAWPEIVSAFNTMGLGDPRLFYDAIITAGFPLRNGEAGTLGELSPKPHPWLYAEACRVGLGIPFEERHAVVGIEDSGVGVCSIRLAGLAAIGVTGGNIEGSGVKALCSHYGESLSEILTWIV